MAKPSTARRARVAATTASTQDYLAAIYDLAGSGKPVIGARLAKHMSISAPAVTEAMLRMPSTCPHGNPFPGMARPPRVEPFPLAQAKEGATVVVERITEEAEADKKLLEYLWRNEVRPGRRLTIVEVAPWAGTITAGGDGPTIALGLPAAAKIWVYRPTDACGGAPVR